MLLLGGKEYIALMHVHKDFNEDELKKSVSSFIGKINQLPPARSNVKRQYRERTVYYLDILEIDGRDVLFKVGVESGTYIRKLINDIGEKSGLGAHMVELRRTKVADLTEDDGLATLQDLEDAVYFYTNDGDERLLNKYLQSIEKAVDFLPKVWISDFAVDTVCKGAPVAVPGVVKLNEFKSDEWVLIYTLKGEIVAIGKAAIDSSALRTMSKGIVVKTDSVIMRPGIYPEYHKTQ
ncbi:MAG: RNA-guided pseudouridylation complex pseudouridine synthase subunit Cbf5 [Candidatus Parvarchaeota archaeon]|nr:RNA-guided pseudouridylation complex pseudouridine synthase subunit Cbf5 [Candidatus Parvarchaeota archaeon]